jgi:serine/threonine protein kinase
LAAVAPTVIAAMNATPHPLVGALFADDYRVESLLAEGGMGAVFAVVQQSTGRRRALKLLRPALASDPSTRERFIREARVGSSIESDHVVEVIDAGFDPATSAPFLVMELLDGSDLHRYVTARGALEVREAREVLRQLCHALAAAHAAGVIHRDLKPENVFVARSRRADVPFTIKLLDFGIASVLEQSATSHATGAIVGSPAWMAPEQVDTGLIRASTDVWALGLIAFWAPHGKALLEVRQPRRLDAAGPARREARRAARPRVAARAAGGLDRGAHDFVRRVVRALRVPRPRGALSRRRRPRGQRSIAR